MRLTPLALSLAIAGLGCDDAERPKNPFDPSPSKAKEPPPITEAPKSPPDFHIDTISAKVGFSQALLDKPEGKQKLAEALSEHREMVTGKTPVLRVDRKARPPWVATYIDELSKLGAEKVTVKTDTRDEFPKELLFVPEDRASSPASCSVVAMVLDDRGTAVWKLSGGVASKRSKGFAGPDLTMTAETLQRFGKACRESDFLFVSAAEEIEWGLAYDLAASAKKVEKTHYDKIVLLRQVPVPGHKVDLGGP
jgi:hypothetical protein